MRVLVLSPHTDDAELACGGYISRLVEEKNKVLHVGFSSMIKGRYEYNNCYEQEFRAAGIILGVETKIFDYPMREFPEKRQQILQEMVKVKECFVPELVLLPSSFDTHQDHQVIRDEGFRAFKDSSILGYETPWNNIDFKTNCFVPLTKFQLERKMAAVGCYKSQIGNYPYFNEEYIWAHAVSRGMQIKTKYAEAYEVIRWVL